jgi:tetratricopeptide (TPR) repeat protein
MKAVAAFKKVLAIQPQAPHIAYNIGLISKDRKERREAAIWFDEALKANPGDKDAAALLNKMIAYQNQGD